MFLSYVCVLDLNINEFEAEFLVFGILSFSWYFLDHSVSTSYFLIGAKILISLVSFPRFQWKISPHRIKSATVDHSKTIIAMNKRSQMSIIRVTVNSGR